MSAPWTGISARAVQQIVGFALLAAALWQIVVGGLDPNSVALLTPALAILGLSATPKKEE